MTPKVVSSLTGIPEMRSSLATLIAVVVIGGHTPALGQLASSPAGDWTGSYTCMQGRTGLRLTITPKADGAVDALFRFGYCATIWMRGSHLDCRAAALAC
jgi:hypothetical protein